MKRKKYIIDLDLGLKLIGRGLGLALFSLELIGLA